MSINTLDNTSEDNVEVSQNTGWDEVADMADDFVDSNTGAENSETFIIPGSEDDGWTPMGVTEEDPDA